MEQIQKLKELVITLNVALARIEELGNIVVSDYDTGLILKIKARLDNKIQKLEAKNKGE